MATEEQQDLYYFLFFFPFNSGLCVYDCADVCHGKKTFRSQFSLYHRVQDSNPSYQASPVAVTYLSTETLTNSCFLQLNDFETNRIRDDVSEWCR